MYNHQHTRLEVSILVNHQRISLIKVLIGTQCSVISKSQLSSKALQKSHAAFGGECLNVCGRVAMKYEYKGNVYAGNFEVVDQEVSNILGLPTCVEMNLVQRLDAINNHDTDFLDSYSNVFDELSCI